MAYKFSDLKQALKKNELASVINDIVANLSPADINKAVKTFNPGLEQTLFDALTPENLLKVAESLDPSVAAGLANLPPVFLAFTEPSYTDTAGDDAFADATGTFQATDINNNPLTYGLVGGSAAAVAIGGVTYNQVASSGYGALYLNTATGAYRFVPNDNGIEALTGSANANFTVTVTDGTFTASQGFSVTFNGVNDAPVAANAIADQSVAEDTTWSFQVPADTFADVDNAALSYSATVGNGDVLPTWLSFNAATRTFSGTPPQDFNGTLDLTVTASDGSLTASDTFTLTVTAVNDAPVVAGAIADQASPEDQAWSFQVSAGAFSDVDGDTLSYTATLGNGNALPGWLSFNAATRTFSGTPPQDFNGSLDLAVTASDGSLSASDTFTFTITPVNDAPVVANAIADQSSPEDTAWSFQVPADAFSDVDNATLSYTATLGNGDALPGWLSFDGSTRTFLGTPPQDFNGSLDLTVTASDGSLSVSDTFMLTITPVNDAPTTTPVTLAAIAEDSGARLITQAELLENANDVDNPSLSAVNLAIATGGGSLANNNNGTWSYTPAANDDTQVSFSYQVTDGALSAAGSATLDITPVDDAPAGTLDIVTSSGRVLYGDGIGDFAIGLPSFGAAPGFPGAFALGDFNNDGNLDIVNGGLVQIGDGAGGFTRGYEIGSSFSAAVGDLNNDGNLDIVAASHWGAFVHTNTVSVLLGNGMGGFTASTQSIGAGYDPLSVAIGDLNNDGNLDIVTANATFNVTGNLRGNNVSVLSGDGMGGFTASTIGLSSGAFGNPDPFPWSVALGDVNNDGNLDIVTANLLTNRIDRTSTTNILTGDGMGGFSVGWGISGIGCASVALGDLNNDGNLDYIFGSRTPGISGNNIFVQAGDGRAGFAGFGQFNTGGFVSSVALGDLNADGNLDVVASTNNEFFFFTPQVVVLLGDGTAPVPRGDGTFGGFYSTTGISGIGGMGYVALGYVDDFLLV